VPFVLLDAVGLKLTSAAEAAAIAPTLMPVFAGLFAWAFLRHRQRRSRCLAYAAIVAGFLAGAAVLRRGARLPPAIAAILSTPVLRETPSLAEATAIAVVVLGVLLAAKPAPAQDTPHVPQT
jgi:drug/metabolite transporter (DMT)-like permease